MPQPTYEPHRAFGAANLVLRAGCGQNSVRILPNRLLALPKPMHIRTHGIVAFLIALTLHAAVLAAVPLVWCIGSQGHSAIEVCITSACHAKAQSVAPRIEGLLTNASASISTDPHSNPCSDVKAADTLLEAPQFSQLAALPANSAIASIRPASRERIGKTASAS